MSNLFTKISKFCEKYEKEFAKAKETVEDFDFTSVDFCGNPFEEKGCLLDLPDVDIGDLDVKIDIVLDNLNCDILIEPECKIFL